MEEIGSEVSHKIRAAIKAKLIELGVYIDGELPDYIMVMVANKRTRQQMNEDLQLFLGSNTKSFTAWLYTVLQRLQEVTVANFDPKDVPKNKGEKRKRSESEDSAKKGSKSSDEQSKMGKKHMKDVKEEKKLKKSKFIAKEKEKDKNLEEKQASTETVAKDRQKKPGGDKETESSRVEPDDSSGDKSKDKASRKDEQNLSGPSVPKTPGKVNNSNAEHGGTSAKSSSPSHYSDVRNSFPTDSEEEDSSFDDSEDEESQDEFNIEPLNKTEDQSKKGKFDDKPKTSKSESQSTPTGMTIKAPTRELLREHNKIIREREGRMSKKRQEYEEIRRLVNKLPKNTLPIGTDPIPPKKKSRTSDVEVLQTSSKSKEETTLPTHRAKRISQRRDHDVEEDENTYNRDGSSSNPLWEKGCSTKDKNEGENSRSAIPSTSEPKSNIISISKSLEMEKNLGVKSQEYKKKSVIKTTSGPKKKPVPSRIFTIPEPETPEIPSVIKVKPREFVPKDKQASKALILKAVADAEKSIATLHPRHDSDKKTEEKTKKPALFTKNLRAKGKRYEKLAVTLSNVQAGGTIADRVKSKRVVSVDSEKTKAQDRKTESLKDSEQSQDYRSIPDLTLKNISSKSEDQFISSKTSAMEKNDKYIHCWLEGVEKAVENEEIVNPSEIEDFHICFSGEGRDPDRIPSTDEEDTISINPKDEEEMGRKKSEDKISAGTKEEEEYEEEEYEEEEYEEEEEEEDEEVQEDEDEEEYEYEYEYEYEVEEDEDGEDGPQILVTLDGPKSKAAKDIVYRKEDIPDNLENDSDDEVEERPGLRYKEVDSSKEAGTSKQSGSGSHDKANKLEKISERFGRINKTSENHEFKEKYHEFERERYEKKCLKNQGTEKEKQEEKLKDKYASEPESKNKKLIARLSEKFGKVDREFDDKKRKYSDDDLRYSCQKKVDKGTERDAKSSKRDRNPVRSEKPK